MWTKTTLAASVASLALLAGSFNSSPVAYAADDDARAADTQKDTPKTEVYEGKVVNLHLYLTGADTPVTSDAQKQRPVDGNNIGAVAPQQSPIAIEIKDSGLAKLVPGHTAYIVCFDHANQASVATYGTARDLLGHNVKVTGKLYDRGGIKGLMIEKVESMEVEAAELEKPAAE